YGPDTVWQKEFEEIFPFEETEDQLAAIEDTKRDMESGKIMDRLICGDVGFGKTEVAIRAAFKAVQEGKQVAYLVPTTILAQQHYNTFRERMQEYPVTVELMSRFRTEKELKETVKGLRSGMTDIVIGTHRILSKDVKFKDLGLLIIDEEQRFGVKHKEKIKQLKTNVDVLTLTATPIPRTLHMSMIGVRDMSVLSEPPQDRQAIQTYVMEYSEELVREAIHREIARGGQVYYVYNRVQDIDEVAAKVQDLCPEAVVSYAHGKMSEQSLENRMLDFINGEIDVLVSTTIIETGLDIPNVNTIIIHDAERYGLSQLYQLRGRVGRSNRQAYAFIMYRKNRILSEDSQKRLEAIRQFTELGSGMKIAMQDLEIRGAGSVLGNAQSGHMAQVGYDLYCKMLSLAVQRARNNEEDTESFETLLDIKVDAFIPPSYIDNEALKLETYKKISLLETEEDREALADELIDRYGDIPRQVENLMEVSLLRVRAKELYFSEIKGNTAELTFRFVPFAKIPNENVPKLIKEMNGAMHFIPSDPPGLGWHEMNVRNIGKTPILKLLKDLLEEIKRLLIQ
ncbi:MAG: DEAD/DEAH box helicase, partial [Lachnospiraceae bacterium]|nr:DEAD/DEAH box helicase [Lachnospiraceae bacterium]